MSKTLKAAFTLVGFIFAILMITGKSEAASNSLTPLKRTPFASSGKRKVNVIELYSSESCSSCPPADKWISTLIGKPGLFTEFIPIVFHVDYWNDLGWKDGFSSNLMTKRQQEIVRTWARPAVYTPGFVLNGKEWRERDFQSISNEPKHSDLTLNLFREKNDNFSVAIEGLKPGDASYTVRAAKLGFGLITKVESGENSGETLKHDFVVLDWTAQNVNAKSPNPIFKFTAKPANAPKSAIVVWIEKVGNPTPLQATGAHL